MSNLITKSVVVYPERQGAVFQASDEINFYLPPSLGLLNPDTYLRFNLKMKGLLKKQPCQSAGAASIISSVVVMSGDGRTIYETLDNYAIKAALYYHYTENEGAKFLRNLHEGKPNKSLIEGGLGGRAAGSTENKTTAGASANQYVVGDATTSTSWAKDVECLLPLWCSGCLSPNRDKVFPLIATQGLRVRIQLNSVKDATQVLSAPIYNGATGAVSTLNAYGKLGGGYQNGTFLSGSMNGAGTVITIYNDEALTTALFNNVDVARCGGVANPAHPFVVGQKIIVEDDGRARADEAEIQSIAVSGAPNYNVELTLTGAMNAAYFNDTQLKVGIRTTDAANPDEGYEVSNLSFVCGVVVPDGDYIRSVQRGVAAGKFMIDIHTYQDYPINITANSKQNALYIKSINSRAKALLSVPIKTADAEDYVDDSFVPDIQNLDNYQYYLYGTLTPNRVVSMKEFQLLTAAGVVDKSQGSFSGEGIREMEHAVAAAGWPVNNLLRAWEHPFVGRRLATPGYSMALNREGDVRLNLNYDSKTGPSAALVHNFVEHIRRITVAGNNQEVML